ncbi:MAG TPA: GNAT family N-acetyltransferase [Rectinemataceae bacterium]|nr:GNAT family N-acetyltransferase [Rectinemataceae bacterium]
MTGWNKLTPGDAASLSEFLVEEEYRCVALSERLRRWLAGKRAPERYYGASGWTPWVHLGGAAAIDGSVAIDGAAILHADGAGSCILPKDGSGDRAFVALAEKRGGFSSLMGPAGDLERIVTLSGTRVSDARRYLLMRRPAPEQAREPAGQPAGESVGETTGQLVGETAVEPAGRRSQNAFAGTAAGRGTKILFREGDIEIRRASALEFPSLCALHEAYEDEEMEGRQRFFSTLLPERVFTMLRRQIAVVAFWKGRGVGKANTNARGIHTDQLGGIYVSREFRNRGIGGIMVGSLCALLESRGRETCLYVKPDNEPALALYAALGFAEAGAYAAYVFSDGRPQRKEGG